MLVLDVANAVKYRNNSMESFDLSLSLLDGLCEKYKDYNVKYCRSFISFNSYVNKKELTLIGTIYTELIITLNNVLIGELIDSKPEFVYRNYGLFLENALESKNLKVNSVKDLLNSWSELSGIDFKKYSFLGVDFIDALRSSIKIRNEKQHNLVNDNINMYEFLSFILGIYWLIRKVGVVKEKDKVTYNSISNVSKLVLGEEHCDNIFNKKGSLMSLFLYFKIKPLFVLYLNVKKEAHKKASFIAISYKHKGFILKVDLA